MLDRLRARLGSIARRLSGRPPAAPTAPPAPTGPPSGPPGRPPAPPGPSQPPGPSEPPEPKPDPLADWRQADRPPAGTQRFKPFRTRAAAASYLGVGNPPKAVITIVPGPGDSVVVHIHDSM